MPIHTSAKRSRDGSGPVTAHQAQKWLEERYRIQDLNPEAQAVRNFYDLLEAAKQGREAFDRKFEQLFPLGSPSLRENSSPRRQKKD